MEDKNKKIDKSVSIVKTKDNKSSNDVIKKIFSRTLYTIIALIIIVLAYIGINILVKKADISDIDMTKDKVYSLSDESKKITRAIDKNVDIILVNMSEVQSVIDFSNKYSKENSKIKVKEVTDINKEPELTAKYGLTSETSEIIITSGDKEKLLTSYDLYTVDYSTYEEKDITEEAMTNALLNVTTDTKPKIYFLSGHSSTYVNYMVAFRQVLEDKANEVYDLDLLVKGDIPEDCDVLAITTLEEDIKDVEKDAIIRYIKKGGKIILFSDANISKINKPNFQKVLDEYGFNISEGILIEQDADKMLANSPSAILVTVNQETSITKNINMTTSACFINSGKINIKDEETLESMGVEVETLATTSEEAFYREDLSIDSLSKQSNEEEGSSIVGALFTKKIDNEKNSKLIVYSNNLFITSMQVQLSSQSAVYAYDLYNNEDLALNSISYLTDREDTIMIRKDVEVTTYSVTQKQQVIILIIIFSLPAIIIIAGIIVWQMRRRKK